MSSQNGEISVSNLEIPAAVWCADMAARAVGTETATPTDPFLCLQECGSAALLCQTTTNSCSRYLLYDCHMKILSNWISVRGSFNRMEVKQICPCIISLIFPYSIDGQNIQQENLKRTRAGPMIYRSIYLSRATVCKAGSFLKRKRV